MWWYWTIALAWALGWLCLLLAIQSRVRPIATNLDLLARVTASTWEVPQNVSVQTGYSSQQTGSAFPILLQKCVAKGNMAPKAFTYSMELHLIWLLQRALKTTGWKVLQNCTYILSLTDAVAMWLYNFLRGFKHGWNHNSLHQLYLFSFSHVRDKLRKCFPWSFGLLFILLAFEHLFLIFGENTIVVLAFFHMECYIWC